MSNVVVYDRDTPKQLSTKLLSPNDVDGTVRSINAATIVLQNLFKASLYEHHRQQEMQSQFIVCQSKGEFFILIFLKNF